MFSFFKKKKQTELDNLLPFVRPLWWFESHVLSGYENTKTNTFFMFYEADLGIGLFSEQQGNLKILEKADVEKYGKTDEQMLSICVENLLDKGNAFSKTSLFTKVHDGVWSSFTPHLSSSGLILLKHEVGKLDILGQPTVFFVGKDQILITGSNDTKGMLYCMIAIKNLEHTSFISRNVYTLRENQWCETIFTTSEIDIVNEYLGNCRESYMIDTNKFLNILEEKNETSEDFQISEVSLGWKNGQSFLYTLWIEATKTWLSKVDKIILAPLSQQNLEPEKLEEAIQEQTFDWDVVENIYSHKMRQLDYFHEVWELTDFPTVEEIQLMKHVQKNKNDLEREGLLLNDHKPLVFRYKDGSLKYFGDKRYSIIHGIEKKWNEEGILTEENYYWRNTLDGLCKKWHTNGVLESATEYDMGFIKTHRSFDIGGNLIEEIVEDPNEQRQRIFSSTEYSDDYKRIIKYEKFYSSSDELNEEILAQLKKSCYIVQKEDITNSSSNGFSLSLMGNVTLSTKVEEWPRASDGVYLSPLMQLRIKDLPETPAYLQDIDYLMIFTHPEGCYEDSDTLCIRAYPKNSKLIPLTKPESVICNPKTIRFHHKFDFPSNEMPKGVQEYLNQKYPDPKQEASYECHSGTKVLGWPQWIQFATTPLGSEFIMQIDEYGEKYWDWGDCPNLYIFRDIKTGEFYGTVEMY